MKALRSIFILSLCALFSLASSAEQKPAKEWIIPAEGNSFITKQNASTNRLSENRHFLNNATASVGKDAFILKKEAGNVISTFAYLNEAADPIIYIKVSGNGKLSVNSCGKRFTVKVGSQQPQKIKVGKVKVKEPSHLRLDFSLASSDPNAEVRVEEVILSGVEKQPYYITEEYSAYFGRRGPSVHLQYLTREFGEGDWAYDEVTVPEDGDVEYTYYCALGFNSGYFGFQNNGNGKRCVIFSIWNAQDADNPNDVSEPYRAKLISKGEQTISKDFGNEGSGCQTFLNYLWKPGNTYRFALHAEHKVPNTTDYSAYFYTPDENRWIYVATVRRPFTDFLLRGLHSFLENFHPEQGAITRRAYYHNVWLRQNDTKEWRHINKIKITNDETGRIGKRVDFDGGAEGDRFYLKNCGYFGNGDLIKREVEIPENNNPSPKDELIKLK